jgi:hypothetical protein
VRLFLCPSICYFFFPCILFQCWMGKIWIHTNTVLIIPRLRCLATTMRPKSWPTEKRRYFFTGPPRTLWKTGTAPLFGGLTFCVVLLHSVYPSIFYRLKSPLLLHLDLIIVFFFFSFLVWVWVFFPFYAGPLTLVISVIHCY